jgi:hypothetical protein
MMNRQINRVTQTDQRDDRRQKRKFGDRVRRLID